MVAASVVTTDGINLNVWLQIRSSPFQNFSIDVCQPFFDGPDASEIPLQIVVESLFKLGLMT